MNDHSDFSFESPLGIVKNLNSFLGSLRSRCATHSASARLVFLLPLQYTQGIDSVLKEIKVNVSMADLLNDEQKHLLQDLGKKSGFLHLNFTSVLEQVRKWVMRERMSLP